MSYYYSRRIKMSFEGAVDKIIQSLQRQGFSLITTIDLARGFKNDLHTPFRNYTIITACNPQLAYNAISIESHMGLKVPCNIVVQQHENVELEISVINPMETLEDTLNITNLPNIAAVVTNHLRIAIDDLCKGPSYTRQKEALPVHPAAESLFPLKHDYFFEQSA